MEKEELIKKLEYKKLTGEINASEIYQLKKLTGEKFNTPPVHFGK